MYHRSVELRYSDARTSRTELASGRTEAAVQLIRIAIADDDPAMLQYLTLRFDVAGLEVVGTASDGFEAVALVEAHRPDVLVLDLDMPGLDGRGVIPRVRSACASTRIVVHSAEDHVHGLDAAAVVSKSAPSDSLLKAISAGASAANAPAD
jgi:DNA-binding NarL/FixJ family response regulator